MTDARGELRDKRASMGVLDAIALGAALLGLAVVWAIQLFMVPQFVGLFADFATDTASLPGITQLVVRPLAVSLVSLVVLVLAGVGLALRLGAQRGLGGAALGLAIALAWLAVPVMLYALYAPMLTLSRSISP